MLSKLGALCMCPRNCKYLKHIKCCIRNLQCLSGDAQVVVCALHGHEASATKTVQNMARQKVGSTVCQPVVDASDAYNRLAWH